MACLDCPICNISMELPLWDDKPVSGGPAPHDLLCGSPVSDTVSPRVPGDGDSLVKFHLVHASGEDEGRESDSIFDEDHSGFAYGHKENAVDSSVNSAHSEESGFCSSETTLNLQCAESALWWTGETSVDPDEIAVTLPLVPHTHQSTKRQSFTGFEEYNFDVYCHRKEVEKRSHFTDCLKNQVEITPGIRGVLVSWLSKVHKEFQLSLDTLFLTVNIVDRLLKVKPVSRECFQLVGATAMLIAGKHEEVTPPEIQDLLWVCGDTYTREQMKELEKIMLEAIHFDLFVPTASFFLEYYAFCEISTVDDINRLRNARRQGKYFLELSLQDYELCQYPPSMLALCAWKAAVRDCAHEYNLYPEWESDFPPGGAFDECYQEFTMFMTRLTHCFPEANVLSEVNAYEDVDDSESE